MISPSKTALILLGASKFPNFYKLDDPDPKNRKPRDRKSFHSSHKAVKRYFKEHAQDLVLDPVNDILNLFDEGLDSEVQMSLMSEFLCPGGKPKYSDVFVYIVTHGEHLHNARASENEFRLKADYYLMIRDSLDLVHHPGRHATYINFEGLFNLVYNNAGGRVYFIVDACHSGIIHLNEDGSRPPFYPFGQPTEVCNSPGHRGAAILTANSTLEIGEVLASDSDELTLFTYAFLLALKEGVENGYSFGLSFDLLRYEINRIVYERKEIVRKRIEGNRSDIFNIAQVRDRYLTVGAMRLSDIPVFPNKNAKNTVPTICRGDFFERLSKTKKVEEERNRLEEENLQLHNNVEEQRKRIEGQKKWIERRQNKISDQQREIEGQQRKIKEQQRRINMQETKIGKQKKTIQSVWRRRRDLQEDRSNFNDRIARSRWFIGLAAVLPLAAVALLLAFGPAGWAMAIGEILVSRAGGS